MGDRPQIGLIEDKRVAGETFRSALDKAPLAFQPSLFTDVPEIFFARTKLTGMSGDKQHYLVVGEDTNKSVLLRDGIPVLTLSGEGAPILGIEAANDDFSKVVVSTPYEEGHGSEFYLVDGDKSVSFYKGINSHMLWHNEEYSSFWMSHSRSELIGSRSKFNHITIRDGKPWFGYSFQTGRDIDHPYVRGVGQDDTTVLWTGAKKAKEYLYENDQQIHKGQAIDIRTNGNSSVALVAVRYGTFESEVFLRVIDRLNGGKESSLIRGPFRVDQFVANEDLSRAALSLRYFNNYQMMFYVDGMYGLSNQFEELQNVEIGEDGYIVAKVVAKDTVIGGEAKIERVLTAPPRSENGRGFEILTIDDSPRFEILKIDDDPPAALAQLAPAITSMPPLHA